MKTISMAMLILIMCLPSAGGMKGPRRNQIRQDKVQIVPAKNRIISFAFSIYKNHITRIDGERCPFYPSCSEYSRIAFKKFGILEGWLMTFDRLLRCGHQIDKYLIISFDSKFYWYDPPTSLFKPPK